jgi:hypothetical protein
MFHNPFMRSTKLDLFTSVLVVLFVVFVIAMILGPARLVAKEKDAVRTAEVRRLMAAVIELEQRDPARYDDLLEQLQLQKGRRIPVGELVARDFSAESSEDYYFAAVGDQLEIGSLDPAGEPIVLRKKMVNTANPPR